MNPQHITLFSQASRQNDAELPQRDGLRLGAFQSKPASVKILQGIPQETCTSHVGCGIGRAIAQPQNLTRSYRCPRASKLSWHSACLLLSPLAPKKKKKSYTPSRPSRPSQYIPASTSKTCYQGQAFESCLLGQALAPAPSVSPPIRSVPNSTLPCRTLPGESA